MAAVDLTYGTARLPPKVTGYADFTPDQRTQPLEQAKRTDYRPAPPRPNRIDVV